MVTDRLFRRLPKLIQTESTLAQAADKAGVDEKTARKYRDSDPLPSQRRVAHTWRTREDPFQDVWPQLVDQLRLNPGFQAKTLFVELQRRFPGRFPDVQLRCLQRQSNCGGPSKGRPRRCSSHRPTSRGGSPRMTSPIWALAASPSPASCSTTWSITSS